ncbi:MAG: SGNH/GDSL hydrolase family protein [Phycisphaerae bacterium]|nr:SGNH/GDSL hydrolase family protein [Tepidisphaeraceae bacterium]
MRIGMLAGCIAVVTCGAPNARGGPLIAGNRQIAWDYLYGDAHVLMVGDSIQNSLHHYRYVKNANRLQGIVAGPNYPSSPWLGDDGSFGPAVDPATRPFLGATGLYLANETPPTGVRGANPGATWHAGFTGVAGQQPAADLVTNAAAVVYVVTPFAKGATGMMHADLLTVANPSGTGALTFDVTGASASGTGALASVAISTQAATTGLQRHQLTFQAAGDPAGLRAIVGLTPGQTPAAGSNLVLSGVRVYTGKPGLQLAGIGWGGTNTSYYLDPNNASDADLARYFEFTDTNIVQIWIGHNDGVLADAWEPRIRALLDRYRAARPGVRFILESNYEDATVMWFAGYADVLARIAAESTDVLYLNMYDAVGGAPFAYSPLLVDSVHPSLAGAEYLVDVEYGLIQQAASSVPEPATGGLILTVAFAALAGRRNRRETVATAAREH